MCTCHGVWNSTRRTESDKNYGVRMLKLEPVHGFAAETSATAVILGTSHLGLPVSTTHVIATAIMGVGSTKRLTAVR